MNPVRQESEYQTRRKRIDPLLTSQGWKIVRSDLTNVIASYPHHAVTEYPTANGPADYALFVDNQLLGIVEALAELRQKLATVPERFTLDNLERAHAARYHKNLVDIISMIKHAAKEEEPLLTASERVERAFAKITAGRQFTEEQQKWLDRIRAHLVVSLSIDKKDFENVPVLLDAGGWKSADRAFGGMLSDVIRGLNEAVAA
jgi:EcoEI R protein C-terminal